jgi:hypothetical protein
MNLREKAENLGKLQIEIYWQHDRCEFEELAQSAREIYDLLGYEKAETEIVGKLISDGYKLADQGESFQGINSEKEKQYYQQIELKLREVEKRLNYRITIAFEQAQWWYASRHKNWFKLIYYLFLTQWKPLKISQKTLAFPLTFYLIKVGLGHNKKNQLECEINAIKYWYLLLTNHCELNFYLG